MNKILMVLMVFFFSCSIVLGVGECSHYVYNNEPTADGHDYFKVRTTTYNYTQHNAVSYADISFYAMTSITPRLNFTKEITEALNFANISNVHMQPDGTIQLDFYNATDILIFNGTTVLDESNYTYDEATSTIALNEISFNGTNLAILYNRTFVKNVDDLVTGYSSICTMCGSMYELDNIAYTYGDNVGFRLRQAILNDTNWAVTWTTVNRTCDSYSGLNPVNTDSTINSFVGVMIFFLIVGIFLTLILIVFKQEDENNTFRVIATVLTVVVVLFIIYLLVAIL